MSDKETYDRLSKEASDECDKFSRFIYGPPLPPRSCSTEAAPAFSKVLCGRALTGNVTETTERNDMSICYWCYWGWPEPIKKIHDEAVEKMGGDDTCLHYGSAHIVWDDENWEDHNIQWSLDNLENPEYNELDMTPYERMVVKESLERLLLIPEEMRKEPKEYDGEHPENYPPPPKWNCKRNT